MPELTKWTSLRDFIFNTPLYAPIAVKEAWDAPPIAISPRWMIAGAAPRVDGHCRGCRASSTFLRVESTPSRPDVDIGWEFTVRTLAVRWHVVFSCARVPKHKIEIYCERVDDTIQKIGQFPSLADTAIDDARKYTTLLGEKDQRELHRAIGLAAHGVGIGSFVYLRRLFEGVIQRRFADHAKDEGWPANALDGKRMDEKIEFLSKYLPSFMVANKKTYSILSAGIHELDDEACLAMFAPLKASIIFMLDEDEQARVKEEAKKKLERDLQQIQQNLSQSQGGSGL